MKNLFGLRLMLVNEFSKRMGIRLKPLTLQLPVTSRCNSRCLTCNIWKQEEKHDIDAVELKRILNDDFFSEIRGVGINGGELTLAKNIDEIFKAVFSLKKLRTIWIISNCLLPDRLLALLEKYQKICKIENISLGVTLSIDGIGEIDNQIRGVPVAFERVSMVLDKINQNMGTYCSNCDMGCTISKYNVAYLPQIETYLKRYENIPIYFHVAVPNKRIRTFASDNYSVMTDEWSRLLAAEYFLGKYLDRTLPRSIRLRHWGNYYFLMKKGNKRPTTCDWLYRNVTIDENLDFFLCATASDRIGNLKECSASELVKSEATKKVVRNICGYCDHCIHYSYNLSICGWLAFLKDYFIHFYRNSLKFKLVNQWLKLR